MSHQTHYVTSFYKFNPILSDRLEDLALQIETQARALSIEGLFLIGTEGVNSTLSGTRENIETMKEFLRAHPEIQVEEFKDSVSTKAPFQKLRVRIKPEIVTIGSPGLVPEGKRASHMSAEEWHRTLQEDPHVILLDTRNDYEVKMGKFVGAGGPAIDFNIENFSEFPRKVEEAGFDKNSKVLMYCTGGIRCEKASLAMEKLGFKNVFQLDGGILKYIEQFPDQNFQGDCFVFDSRIAVDQKLNPVPQYSFCPHCGQAAEELLTCVRCETSVKVCDECKKESHLHTCSKNCAYHVKLKPGKKGRHQITDGIR